MENTKKENIGEGENWEPRVQPGRQRSGQRKSK